jgi:hypothetical protein
MNPPLAFVLAPETAIYVYCRVGTFACDGGVTGTETAIYVCCRVGTFASDGGVTGR